MELQQALRTLRRPRLLVRAARRGLAHYRRDRDLRLALGGGTVPRNPLARLADEEAAFETARISAHATYSAARHIAILTALMAEARGQV